MSDMKSDRQEKLHSYFERSAALVNQATDKIDKLYFQPGVVYASKAFAEHPVRSTFLTTFAALSFLPLLAFVGFSLFALGTCTFIALGAALVVSSAAIAFVGFWLAITLTLLFFVSLFLTNAVIGSFLVLRYVSLVRADGPKTGSVEWAREVRRRVRGEPVEYKTGSYENVKHDTSSQTDEHQEEVKEEDGEHEDGKSDVDDTTVVIGEESPDRRFTFKELDGRDSPVFVKRESVVSAVEDVMPQQPVQVVDAF